MDERSIYLLPARAIIAALLGVFVLGGLGGGTVAWFLVSKLLRDSAGGTRVIERVEHVSGSDGEALARVADTVHEGVVGLLDARGALLQTGIVLTADGLIVTPAVASLERSLRVLRSDGTTVPAALLREYPEQGLLFLRIAGSFPAPRLVTDTPVLPGTTGVLLRPVPQAITHAVQQATVTHLAHPLTTRRQERPGVEQWGVLTPLADRLYHGSPLFASDGRLVGITVIDREGSGVLLAPDIDLALQDLLRYPTGDTVSVLGGMRGTWLRGEEAKRRSLPSTVAYLVEAAPRESSAGRAGLRVQDIIVGVDKKPFPTAGRLWAILLEGARNEKPVTLDVRRGDSELQMVFTPSL